MSFFILFLFYIKILKKQSYNNKIKFFQGNWGKKVIGVSNFKNVNFQIEVVAADFLKENPPPSHKNIY